MQIQKTMYVPKCFQRKITKQELIEKLKKMYNKDNKESENLQGEIKHQLQHEENTKNK